MRGIRDWLCADCGHRVEWWRMFCDECGGEEEDPNHDQEASECPAKN